MLEQERAYYDEHVQECLERFAGEYVVVKQRELLGVYDTFDAALRDGTRRAGLRDFLLRQTLPEQLDVEIPGLKTLTVERALGVSLRQHGVIALIGRDILQKCMLTHDGRLAQITLSV